IVGRGGLWPFATESPSKHAAAGGTEPGRSEKARRFAAEWPCLPRGSIGSLPLMPAGTHPYRRGGRQDAESELGVRSKWPQAPSAEFPEGIRLNPCSRWGAERAFGAVSRRQETPRSAAEL